MTNLVNGCSYTDIWVSPADWKTITSKASLKQEWYLQCQFYDPLFKEKYPKGFSFRKKVNKPKTIQERRIIITMLLKEIKFLFESKGYNPITKSYMISEPEPEVNSEINPDTPFIEALNYAFSKMTVADSTYKDIQGIINKIKASSEQLRYEDMPVSEIKRKHIRYIIDNLEKSEGTFSGHKFNKYRTYLQSLYNELVDYEVVESNIIKDIRKKKTTKTTTETLSLEERTAVYNQLKPHFPEFLRFSILYFHSGGRIAEMLRLKAEHVELDKLRYKILVKKGASYKWMYRAIKEIALPYWKEALQDAKKDHFVFSVGLLPGDTSIRREQINRRWRTHIKEKLNITADFRSLKHSNLDEISAQLSLKDAANAAGHTSTDMVAKHYAVGENARAMERIQKMGNEFAPLKAV